jgi:hypothetical protein
MQQWNHTRKAAEKYHVARRAGKRGHNKRKKNITSVYVKNWNVSVT